MLAHSLTTLVHVSNSACATQLCVAATPLSLPGDGTDYSDIIGLIVLHAYMTRQPYTVQGLLRIPNGSRRLLTSIDNQNLQNYKTKVTSKANGTFSLLNKTYINS
jgi:hypothetical protein